MESCFASCSRFTRTEEGGYVADYRDSGNWTSGHVGEGRLIGSNMGVGAPALSAWMGAGVSMTAADMRTLSLDTYGAIARRNYWAPLGCASFPAGIDLMSFDFGWNRGIWTSLAMMIQCLGIAQPSTMRLEPEAIVTAIHAISPDMLLKHVSTPGMKILQRALEVQVDGVAGTKTIGAFYLRQDLRMVAIILALSAAQVRSYRQLSNFQTYGRGWLARSARRQTAALSAAYEAISTIVQA